MKKATILYLLISAFLLCGTSVQCGDKHQSPPPPPLTNDPGDDPEEDPDGYPEGLSVVPFAEKLGASTCSGFYAVVDFEANPRLAFRPQLSRAKKPTAYFADYTAGTPYIAVNGGFFGGSTSVSLLVDNSIVRAFNAPEETMNNVTYPLTRASLGQMADGSFEAVWAAGFANVLYALPASVANDDTKGTAAAAPTTETSGARKWSPKYAIGGGPMLVYDGENVAVENTKREVLSYIAGRNPRTALGFTEEGKLIVLVCDGRGKNGSVGYTFVELADKMLDLECTYAINLDGGGSSVFVGKDGTVMNLPSDSSGATIVERNVPTAVVIAQTE